MQTTTEVKTIKKVKTHFSISTSREHMDKVKFELRRFSHIKMINRLAEDEENVYGNRFLVSIWTHWCFAERARLANGDSRPTLIAAFMTELWIKVWQWHTRALCHLRLLSGIAQLTVCGDLMNTNFLYFSNAKNSTRKKQENRAEVKAIFSWMVDSFNEPRRAHCVAFIFFPPHHMIF